ncbi:probable glycosyltransferase At3g07620 isoform X2 [Humulus lupulus]|uniref:probable glycosyltransferase At3g07620 isoform X2 n=1 Tax=Humulus lupulus TaxID=3486 RepID=UPI002B417F2D|nr:probable glycosyltransferase At3g07620 isoform X2 [Humulus lupulus]
MYGAENLRVVSKNHRWIFQMVLKFVTLQVGTRRLIWIMGLMCALILVFQSFKILPSLKIQQNGDSPYSKSEFIGNNMKKNRTVKPPNLGYVDMGLLQEEAREFQTPSSPVIPLASLTSYTKVIDLEPKPSIGSPTMSGKLKTIAFQEKKSDPVDSTLSNPSLHTTSVVLDSIIGSPPTTENYNISIIRIKRTKLSQKKKISESVYSDLSKVDSNSPIDKENKNNTTLATSGNSNTSLVKKKRAYISQKKRKSESVDSHLSKKGKNSSLNKVYKRNHGSKIPVSGAYSVSEMNNLLIQSRASYHSVIAQWSSAVDHELQDVTLQIENAPVVQNDPVLYAPLYRNVSIFKRSYELMKQTLKVYIYKEGERPILHTPILQGIYASEGWFMKQLEANEEFVTKDPHKAHLFYLPFSSQMLREILYVPNSHNRRNIVQYLKNYLDAIAEKYPFWKRTGGADHFLVACHDWAPKETSRYMAKCIRALCNADVGGGFGFGKDVSLPQTYIYLPNDTLRGLGGKPASERSTLAFFAGRMHGYVRPILLEHWENKDPDMKIFGKLPKTADENVYTSYMKSSKYCISAKGYEVNSPRVIEAIFYECVPVIISDNYVPPFFDVLNWESFAVFVLEKDIPNLKKILVSIPEKRYREMQMMVKRVQQHFLWHAKPVDFDMFHMILHSIWYNRLHQIRPIL